ncbi:hypothetical protein H7E67_03945 [Clostridium gasigenes]|uniref:hyaluronate lyase N-terminal domain-containing protein n=1 Tax=Clostridium gasigenes TaxID=94869 RepID=UPI0016265008|nr:hypothetical protein [Clostridium gasigenes]MBB6622575.1 hypothetical protein [Clostridium gasigenes]
MSDNIRIKRGNNAQFAPLVLLDGEPCFVKDTGKFYIGNGASKTLINPDVVTSVAGKTGVVILTKADVGLGNVDNTTDATKPISTPQQNALNLKAPLANPVFTGTPTCPTPAIGDNDTSMATTAWVKLQGYSLSGSSDIDGGTF